MNISWFYSILGILLKQSFLFLLNACSCIRVCVIFFSFFHFAFVLLNILKKNVLLSCVSFRCLFLGTRIIFQACVSGYNVCCCCCWVFQSFQLGLNEKVYDPKSEVFELTSTSKTTTLPWAIGCHTSTKLKIQDKRN